MSDLPAMLAAIDATVRPAGGPPLIKSLELNGLLRTLATATVPGAVPAALRAALAQAPFDALGQLAGSLPPAVGALAPAGTWFAEAPYLYLCPLPAPGAAPTWLRLSLLAGASQAQLEADRTTRRLGPRRAADHTLHAADLGTVLPFTEPAFCLLAPQAQVPLPVGAVAELLADGPVALTVAAQPGSAVRVVGPPCTSGADGASLRLLQRAPDEWVVSGGVAVPAGPPTVPGPVGTLTLTPADAALAVAWAAPPAGGSPITAYVVELRDTSQNGNVFGAAQTTDGAARTATLAGLLNQAPYEVRVAAANAVGQGPWSAVGTGTPHFAPTAATLDWRSPLLAYRIDHEVDSQFSSWNVRDDCAFLASDQHGTVALAYTGRRLRLDLPTADNGCARLEVVADGQVVASTSEIGNVGGFQALVVELPPRPAGAAAQLLLRRGAGLAYLGYFAVAYFTALDGGDFEAPAA